MENNNNTGGRVAMYNKIYSYIDDDTATQYQGLGLYLKDNFTFVKRTMKNKKANVKSGTYSMSVYIDKDIDENEFNKVIDKIRTHLGVPDNKQILFYYTNGRERGDKKYTYTNFKPLTGKEDKEKPVFISDPDE